MNTYYSSFVYSFCRSAIPSTEKLTKEEEIKEKQKKFLSFQIKFGLFLNSIILTVRFFSIDAEKILIQVFLIVKILRNSLPVNKSSGLSSLNH